MVSLSCNPFVLQSFCPFVLLCPCVLLSFCSYCQSACKQQSAVEQRHCLLIQTIFVRLLSYQVDPHSRVSQGSSSSVASSATTFHHADGLLCNQLDRSFWLGLADPCEEGRIQRVSLLPSNSCHLLLELGWQRRTNASIPQKPSEFCDPKCLFLTLFQMHTIHDYRA